MNKIINIVVSIFVLLIAVRSFGMERGNERPTKRSRVTENNMDVFWKNTPWEITDHVAFQSIKSDSHSGFICVDTRYLELASNFAHGLLQEKYVMIKQLNGRPTLGAKYQSNMAQIESTLAAAELQRGRISACLVHMQPPYTATSSWIKKLQAEEKTKHTKSYLSH
jgi:hypothetical protein